MGGACPAGGAPQRDRNHVTLELTTHNEARVVSCRSAEWFVAEPDFPALLAHSVAAGASRSMAARSADTSGE